MQLRAARHGAHGQRGTIRSRDPHGRLLLEDGVRRVVGGGGAVCFIQLYTMDRCQSW